MSDKEKILKASSKETIDLSRAEIKEKTQKLSKITRPPISDADLVESVLTEADLTQADIKDAKLIGDKLGFLDLCSSSLCYDFFYFPTTDGANMGEIILNDDILNNTKN